MEALNIPNTSALVNEMKIIDEHYNWSRLLTGQRKISKEILMGIAEDTSKSELAVIDHLKYLVAKILLEKLEVTQDLTPVTSIPIRVWERLSHLMSGIKYSMTLKKMRRAEKQIMENLHQHKQTHWEIQYAKMVMEREKRVYVQTSTNYQDLPPDSMTFVRLQNEALVSMKSAFDAMENYNSYLTEEKQILKNLSESVDGYGKYIVDKMHVFIFLTMQNVRSVLKESQFPWLIRKKAPHYCKYPSNFPTCDTTESESDVSHLGKLYRSSSALKTIDVYDPRRVAVQVVTACSNTYTFKKIEQCSQGTEISCY